MAYLKGNSYVDGDLWVNGSIKVKSVKTAGIDTGNIEIPRLKNAGESIPNRVLKFSSEDGELSSSMIAETQSTSEETPIGAVPKNNYTFVTDNNQQAVSFNINSTSTSPKKLIFQNVDGMAFETPSAKIQVGSSIGDASVELVPLFTKGKVLPNQQIFNPTETVTLGTVTYGEFPVAPSGYGSGTGKPWVYPEAFCYRYMLK